MTDERAKQLRGVEFVPMPTERPPSEPLYSSDRRDLKAAANELLKRRPSMIGPLIPGELVALQDHAAIERLWKEWEEQQKGESNNQ
jgi:hypothetical protein